MKILKCWRIAIVTGKKAEIDKVKLLEGGYHVHKNVPTKAQRLKERIEQNEFDANAVMEQMAGMDNGPPTIKQYGESFAKKVLEDIAEMETLQHNGNPAIARTAEMETMADGGSADGYAGPGKGDPNAGTIRATIGSEPLKEGLTPLEQAQDFGEKLAEIAHPKEDSHVSD